MLSRRKFLAASAVLACDSAKAQLIRGSPTSTGNDPAVDYFIANAGGLSPAATTAMNAFVTTGRADGWWDRLVEIYPFCGNSLNAALVKLKANPGNSFFLTNNNFVSGNYSQATGFGTGATTNTTKYLQTGLILDTLGINFQDMTLATSVIDTANQVQSGFLLGDTPPTGGNLVSIADNAYSVNLDQAKSGYSARVGSLDASGYTGMNGGVVGQQATAPAAIVDLATEIVLFRRANNGSGLFANGKIGITAIGHSMLTLAMQKSLSRALLTFDKAVRTSAPTLTTPFWGWFGDSLTYGQDASTAAKQFTSLVCAARSASEVNFGMPNTQMRQDAGAGGNWAIAGINRYQDLLNSVFSFQKVFVMYGQNDWSADPATTGTPSIIADFQSKLTTVLIALAATYGASNVINISSPFNPSGNLTKNNNYLAAIAAASAAVAGSIYVDCYTVLMAQGDPPSFLTSGHLNDSGMALWATTILGQV